MRLTSPPLLRRAPAAFCVVAVFVALLVAAAGDVSASGTGSADRVFHNGVVVPMDGGPDAAALAVRGSRIAAVGSDDEILELAGPETEIVDLEGRALLPGFVEPHLHTEGNLFKLFLDVSPCWADGGDREDCVTTVQGVLDQLRSVADRAVPGEWILGSGLDPTRMTPEFAEFDRDVLDAVIPDHPVFLLNASGHVAYANSAALRHARITKDTPDPLPGRYLRDENGDPTGVMEEFSAFVPVILAALRTNPFWAWGPAFRRLSHALRSFPHDLARSGITTIVDGGVTQAFTLFLHLANGLNPGYPVRVRALVDSEVVEDTGIRPFTLPNGRFGVSGVKVWADGSTQGCTASLLEPYRGGCAERGHGAPNYTDEELYELLSRYWGDEWQVFVHVNGDAATEATLDAFERLRDQRSSERRHGLIHFTVTDEPQVSRAAALDLSVTHLIGHVAYWGPVFANILGPEKGSRIHALADDVRHGVPFSLHSDYAVTRFGPLRLVEQAVTRVTSDGTVLGPGQRIGVEDALRAVTMNAAAEHELDDVTGSLEVGKAADLVVLDADPRAVDPAEIAEVGVVATYLEGRRTYSQP